MTAIAMTRASVLIPSVDATHHVNAPLERLLRKRRLPTWGIDDPNTWVPTHAMLMLAEDVQGIVGPEAFGLWMERMSVLAALGPFAETLRRSRTLNDALRQYRRFYREFRNYAKLSMVWNGGYLWIHRFVDAGSPGNKEILQLYAINEMANVVRLAAGKNWQPKKVVLLSNATALLETMPHLAGASALAGSGFCGIGIPGKLLSQPVRSQPFDHSIQDAKGATDLAPPPDSFSDSLLAVISNLFHDGCPGIDAVADTIGVSRSTLQRGLSAEGLTYRELIDYYRFETAKRLILEDRIKLLDVAAMLEYNDAGSFSRAFQRWAGVSPRAYRALYSQH